MRYIRATDHRTAVYRDVIIYRCSLIYRYTLLYDENILLVGLVHQRLIVSIKRELVLHLILLSHHQRPDMSSKVRGKK